MTRQRRIKKRLKRKAIAKGAKINKPKPTLLEDTMSVRIIFSGLGDSISKMLALEWARHLKSVLYPTPASAPTEWTWIYVRDEAHRQELACADRSLLMTGPTPMVEKFLKRYQISKWVNWAGVTLELNSF